MSDKIKVRGPDVLELAAKSGVDLTTVKASASDGRISKNDVFRRALLDRTGLPDTATNDEIVMASGVLAHAAKRRKEAAERLAAEAAAERGAQLQASTSTSLVSRVAAKGRAFRLNPLVDDVRAQASAAGQRVPSASAPTLFAAGDLPSFCASGIPPTSLLEVPWQARHAMAAASSPDEAYAIRSTCSGSDAELTARLLYSAHDGNQDYEARVQEWQVASMSDDQLYSSIVPGSAEEAGRREAARGDDLSPSEAAVIDAVAGGAPTAGNGREPGKPSEPARNR